MKSSHPVLPIPDVHYRAICITAYRAGFRVPDTVAV